MENPRRPRRPLTERKAKSLDRPSAPRKDSESWDCHCLSLPTAPTRKALHWTARDWARHSESPAPSAEAQGTTAAALTLEETGEFLPSEQRPPQDTKRDKAQRWAQQGWLKTMLNFFLLRTGHEEPREKASRRPRGKEDLSQPPEPPEAPGEPALRKRAHHDKKASRKKQGHKKHMAEVNKAAQDQEAGDQEDGLSRTAAALRSGEAELGPAHRGREDSDRQSFLIRADGAGALDVSPHATGHQQEEELRKPDGLEEPEVQDLSTEAGAPGPCKLSTPPESLGSGEELQPDRASEYREFIQKIISMLQDAEEQRGEEQPQVQEEEVCIENLAPFSRRKSQEKKLSFRRAFYHKKHSSKEPKRVGAAGAASPETRRPKRPSFLPLCVGGHRPSTSSSLDPEDLEYQEPQEPSPAEGEPVVVPEAPFQARGHTPEGAPQLSGVCESKELIILKLVALLQEVDGQLGQQIRRHPSFKRYFYKFSDSSLSKLLATLRSQVPHSSQWDRNLARRLYQFDVRLADKFAGNNSHAICILMGLRDHYNCTRFPGREDQPNIASPEILSPD
uniref:BCL2 interacting protein 5 n=1 Tax=Aotus nancymaae TaxID=37293 RepID=A0A2K5DWI9_AOTNA|nr:uncharacterized protein C6orf222 homolog isoform X3 [Aotus nancymaae]